jgi:hypothetical protein
MAKMTQASTLRRDILPDDRAAESSGLRRQKIGENRQWLHNQA